MLIMFDQDGACTIDLNVTKMSEKNLVNDNLRSTLKQNNVDIKHGMHGYSFYLYIYHQHNSLPQNNSNHGLVQQMMKVLSVY